MRALICLIFITNSTLSGCVEHNTIVLKPIWEEETALNIYLRSMSIKKEVDNMMDMYQELWEDGFLSDDELEIIQKNYLNILLNLGIKC